MSIDAQEQRIEQKLHDLYVDAAPEITKDDITISDETGVIQFNDTASVKLVLDDAAEADNYINLQQWANGWTMADMLYQSPASQSCFDGGNQGQASVPKYMVSNHISAIVPKVMGGLFYEDPPFALRPRPSVTQEMVQAKTAIFAAQLTAMRFQEEVERALEQAALLGTGIMKFGYTEHTKKIRRFKRVGARQAVSMPDGTVKLLDTPDSDDYTTE